jgi:hypothetical protein
MKRKFLFWCLLFISVISSHSFSNESDNEPSGATPEVVENKQKVPKVSVLDISKSQESYFVGDMINLKADLTEINDRDDIIYVWQVRPEVEFVEWIDGSKILFGTGHQPTVYTVFLSVSIKSDTSHQLCAKIIDIDVSVKSADSYSPSVRIANNFEEITKQLALSVIIDASYSKDDFTSDSKYLSEQFKSIKSGLDNRSIPNLDSALDSIRNIVEGFENSKNWEPFFSGLGLSLEKENKTGSLDDIVNISLIMSSISSSLAKLDK